MHFGWCAQRLRAVGAGAQPGPDLGSLPATFGDDLIVPTVGRVAARVVITQADGCYRLDYRETDPAGDPRWSAPRQDVIRASSLALEHVLGTPAPIDVITDPTSWLGHDEGEQSPFEVRVLWMARVFDVVCGALGGVWPQRVGAGSCSVGALVELVGPSTVGLVLPGGEGARADRPGRDAWPSPLFRDQPTPLPDWVELTTATRTGSGGVGARNGGDGVVARLVVRAAAQAAVRADRTRNPPHGIDRAGPPKTTQIALTRLGTDPQPLAAWADLELGAGDELVIKTCGGAGHGFPGYGDIEFDPSDWLAG